MKQVIACSVLLVVVQCLVFVRAHNEPASGFDPRLSQSSDADVVVTTTITHGPVGSNVIVGPKSREDHHLIQGVCGMDNYNAYAGQGMFAGADPKNRTTSMGATVTFKREDTEIVCLRLINEEYDADDEEVGGYPYVDAGGIGFNYVTMRFESPNGQEMVFQFEIYAWQPEIVTTTTPAPGGAEAVGKSRGHWLLLCFLVVVFKCAVIGGHIL